MAGQSSKSSTQIELLCMLLDEEAEAKALTLPLLSEITNGFSDKMKIGSGGFTDVYKGVLENNRAVVVKKLSNTHMHEKEFLREAERLMKVRHKNIVRFLGYCVNGHGNMASNKGEFIIADVQPNLLCFEYLPKGSLYDYIKDASGGLDWRTRYQIIKGLCEGLQYLHQMNIVHLDLKPANVFLDEKMIPKINYFGFSRCFKDNQAGYLAPESYSGTSKITYKFDMYSLGVMITEIITGERGYQDVDYVVASWSNRCGELQWEQIRVCTEIGLECSDPNPGKSPKSMKHIVDRLAEMERGQVVAVERVLSPLLIVHPTGLCFSFKKGDSILCPLHLTNTTDKYVIFMLEHKDRLAKGRRLLRATGHGIVPPMSTYTLVLGTRIIYDELEEKGIDDLVLHSTTLGHEQIRRYQREGSTNPLREFRYSHSAKHRVALKAFCTLPRGVRISRGIKELRRYGSGHNVYSLDTVQTKKWIIVGEDRGHVTIWDNRTQKQVDFMKVSRETVTCVKFIARKQWLVVGTNSGYIHVYKCETKMQKITSFRATDMYLKSLAVHPSLPYLLLPDHGGMKLWDWDKGFECIHNFEKEHFKEISQVAFNQNDTIASASADHLVKVWSLGSPKSMYTLSGHSNIVNCLAFFTCDDQEYLVTGSDDETAKIWDMRTKICIQTLENFLSPVTCVVYEPNLQILITGSQDGCICYWNTLNSSRLERIINTGNSIGPVNGLACLMGRVVIGRESSAVIMDIDNLNNYQVEYMENDNNVSQLTGEVTCKLVISPRVKITSKETTEYDLLYSMDEHPTEPWIITGHDKGEIIRWNYYSQSVGTDHHNKKPEGLRRGSQTCIYPQSTAYDSRKPVWAIKFIGSKQRILAGSDDGVIHVYNYCVSGGDELEKITTFRAPDDYRVTSLAIHSTQLHVMLSKPPHNHEMEVWGWDKGWECTQIYGDMINPNSFVSAAHQGTELQVQSPDSPKSDHTLPGHSDSVNCLHYFTRDDRQYLITGSDDCTAKIWDFQKKACIHTMAQEAIMSPVLSVLSLLPHRPYLLTGSEYGTVQVWSSTDFRLERTLNFGGGGPVRGLACLMGSPRVVVAQGRVISIMEIDHEVEVVAREVNN